MCALTPVSLSIDHRIHLERGHLNIIKSESNSNEMRIKLKVTCTGKAHHGDGHGEHGGHGKGPVEEVKTLSRVQSSPGG